MVAEGEILGDEVGFLGDKSADDGPDDPEKEHRHLLCSGIEIGAGGRTRTDMDLWSAGF